MYNILIKPVISYKKIAFLLSTAFLLLFSFVSCNKKDVQSDILAEYASAYEQVVAQQKSVDADALRNAPPRYTKEEFYKMINFSPDEYIDVEGNLKKEKFIDYLVKKLRVDASVAKTSVVLMSEYLDEVAKLDENSISTISSMMSNVIQKNVKTVKDLPVTKRQDILSFVANVDYTVSQCVSLNYMKSEKTLQIALDDCKRARDRRLRSLNGKTAIGAALGACGAIISLALSYGGSAFACVLGAAKIFSDYAFDAQEIEMDYADCVRMAHRDYGDKK